MRPCAPGTYGGTTFIKRLRRFGDAARTVTLRPDRADRLNTPSLHAMKMKRLLILALFVSSSASAEL
ncbi:MAG: hypothetical protein WCA32_21125, partial [Chromatiaceae bacterium]